MGELTFLLASLRAPIYGGCVAKSACSAWIKKCSHHFPMHINKFNRGSDGSPDYRFMFFNGKSVQPPFFDPKALGESSARPSTLMAEANVASSLGMGEEFLRKAGVPEAKISAELLLAHVLKIEKWKLYLEPERRVRRAEHGRFWTLVKKRATRYPLQYLLGAVPFRNALIRLDERCLIPRPETELLVEAVLRRIGRSEEALHLLEIGTGSGNIAVSLAQERPRWTLEATDVSSRALELAQMNAQKNGVESRIHFIEADLWNGNQVYDAIISNPPYLTASEMSALQPEICFEPSSALDGGPDGLDYYRRIAVGAPGRLGENGMVFFEVGLGQAGAVSRIFKETGFHSIEIAKDDAGIERIISAGR